MPIPRFLAMESEDFRVPDPLAFDQPTATRSTSVRRISLRSPFLPIFGVVGAGVSAVMEQETDIAEIET